MGDPIFRDPNVLGALAFDSIGKKVCVLGFFTTFLASTQRDVVIESQNTSCFDVIIRA